MPNYVSPSLIDINIALHGRLGSDSSIRQELPDCSVVIVTQNDLGLLVNKLVS